MQPHPEKLLPASCGAIPAGNLARGGGSYDLAGPSNTFSYSTRPVKAGETPVLFGVGFGPTTPHLPAGQVFGGAAPTNSPVTVTIGGVPAGTGSGDQALVATVNGVQTSPGPLVSVQ